MLDIVKQYAKDHLSYMYIDIIKNDSLMKQSCDCEQYFKQIDDAHVEVTVDTGYGHVITLLFVNTGLHRNYISVKQIAYFGDLLNIVNLRRHGFYDDIDLLTNSHCNSTEFFKTHAKKYAVTVTKDTAFGDAIQRVIEVGMKKLFKTGMSKEALAKKSKHEQAVADNRTIYDLVNTHEDTMVQNAIKSVIDEQHKETILTTSYAESTVKELFTNPYTNETYSRMKIVDSVVSNPDDLDNSKIAVKFGLSFWYTMQLDNATQEMSIVGDITGRVDYELDHLKYIAFKDVAYVDNCSFCYNARREILDKCPFMTYERTKVSLESVKKLVRAFIESIDRVNRLIAFQANAAID